MCGPSRWITRSSTMSRSCAPREDHLTAPHRRDRFRRHVHVTCGARVSPTHSSECRLLINAMPVTRVRLGMCQFRSPPLF